MKLVDRAENVVSIKQTELVELEANASLVLQGFAQAERSKGLGGGWYSFVGQDTVRELAETALRVVQLEQGPATTKRSLADVVGAVIGYGVVVAVILVAAAAIVWAVRSAWEWAL